MTVADAVSLGIAAVQIALAVLIANQLRRERRFVSWLTPLVLYFAIRAGSRIAELGTDASAGAVLTIIDGATGIVLLLLLGMTDRVVRELRNSVRRAEAQRLEYERALHDYHVLVRHRLANPLTAARGCVQTLREIGGLSQSDRDHLLTVLDLELRRIQNIALLPTRVGPEERELDAVPHTAASENEPR